MGKRHKVLVADDEEGLRFVLSEALKHEGCAVDLASNGEEALQRAMSTPYDLYVLDMKMPKCDGMEVLRGIRRRYPDALVVMITAFGTQKLAIEALQAGAYDYFTKPFEMDELRIILGRALEKQALLRKVQVLEKKLGVDFDFHGMIGRGEKMHQVYDLIQRVAGHDVTVLITGESGVGKELAAEALHEIGAGADKPFVKINCAAIPEALLESELFGHERGAFTGAIAAKPGKFEIADQGSILLDEIGEMPLSLQAKLLRVLQEKKVERVGSTRLVPVKVRIIASTNRDLAEMIRRGAFREDLYFRINVVPIHIPPLRERIEDLAPLLEHFIAKHQLRSNKQIRGVSPEALRAMESYAWPGNIRELENVIHRAIVMTSGNVIDLGALSPVIADNTGSGLGSSGLLSPRDDEPGDGGDEEEIGRFAEQIERVVEREEKRLILAALKRMKHRRQETADLLGISRKSLHNKMIKYDLQRKP